MGSPDIHMVGIATDGQEIQPLIALSQSASLNQQDQVALDDFLPEDRLRSAWDDIMKGADGSWRPHKEAWALMISWADEMDKMNTSGEVEKLATVFSEKFKYGVEKAPIQNNSALPRQQVSRDLANFVHDHDGLGNLLIIYYAGHGSKGPPGTLNLTAIGNSRPRDKINQRNAIPWHEVENLVKETRADVLTIFDCCYAGNLCRDTRSPDPIRNFEFLGATEDGTTPLPGENSFTSALILALEKLSTSNKPFSTAELFYQIDIAPYFPKKQHPVLKQRDIPSNHRLMLAPIPDGAKLEQSDFSRLLGDQGLDSQTDIKRSVDLRFFFKEFPTEENVTHLSKKMKELLDGGEISATRISWVGLSQRNIVRTVAKKWLSIISSKTRSPTSPGGIAAGPPLTPVSSGSVTPPETRAKRRRDNASEDDHASATKHRHRKVA